MVGAIRAGLCRIEGEVLFFLSLFISCCAAVPAVLTLVNLREYRDPPPAGVSSRALPAVTVIVPARNEAGSIAACVDRLLQSRGIDLRVLVLDDSSTDGTAAIVEQRSRQDDRLSLLHTPPLPAGWNGKQHACWHGAQAAGTPLLCFVDADVRLEPEALARMATLLVQGDGRPTAAGKPAGEGGSKPDAAAALAAKRSAKAGSAVSSVGAAAATTAAPFAAALVSGFPLEETGTPLEWLLLPLIHFVLLGLLPMRLLRTTTAPGVAAGCGQFLLVDRLAYFDAGGHRSIRATMHDGLRLPRLLRAHGYGTRLADLTSLARCRMYTSAAATWNGLAKNATEGLGSPGAIVPMTVLLGAGQVLPLPLLLLSVGRLLRLRSPGDDGQHTRAVATVTLAAAAVALSYLPRVLEQGRFRQDRRSVPLHPVGVATLLALQWVALGRKLLGRPATWKSRSYSAQ